MIAPSWTRIASRYGFTLPQLIIVLVVLALLTTCGFVIYGQLHKSSSANGGLTPVSTNNTPTTEAQINAARTTQNQRQCAALSPAQKAQMAKVNMQSPCSAE